MPRKKKARRGRPPGSKNRVRRNAIATRSKQLAGKKKKKTRASSTREKKPKRSPLMGFVVVNVPEPDETTREGFDEISVLRADDTNPHVDFVPGLELVRARVFKSKTHAANYLESEMENESVDGNAVLLENASIQAVKDVYALSYRIDNVEGKRKRGFALAAEIVLKEKAVSFATATKELADEIKAALKEAKEVVKAAKAELSSAESQFGQVTKIQAALGKVAADYRAGRFQVARG